MRLLKLFILIIITTITLFPQSAQTLLYRQDAHGDVKYRREGLMDGNLVRTRFYNNGEVGQWPYSMSGEWPKGSGHTYLDGVAVLITTEITTPGNNQINHPMETSYREWMDKDPLTGTIWGMEPVPGYLNEKYTKPAMVTDMKSWPVYWPSALNLTPEWNGYWYGYFGRGVVNSEFETFFVMDDAVDGEWTRMPYLYFPIKSDTTRGGIGLRTEIRGFQWSHVLAEDIVFWHYDIANLADSTYQKTYFGFYTDCGVGGKDDSEDDNASFDKRIDLAYCYDSNSKGVPNDWKTGYYGYAYLESPGNAEDGIDNDDDGLLNERRDDGIDNDHDWIGYGDVNGNGKWDKEINEPLNNDVGRDGVGPFDPQYLGSDQGEGDGIPTDGEPNFDKTDKDESDQIGLTAVSIYKLGQGGTGGGWPKDDEAMWLKMSTGLFDTAIQRSNISMVFSSGAFPLLKNGRERFSMALVFGTGLEDIKFNKETVQQIYNANYNFSKPPYKPTVTAVAGDKKVFLYWNTIAEESRDAFLGFEKNNPLLGYKKDFEGYRVYRSEEFAFNDIKTITDSKGEPKYWRPEAQWDLIDSITGPDPVGINGASFWRGDDTGLEHSYIDSNLTNGKRYYYAVVSYDMGDPKFGTKGLQPSECTKIITEDFAGNVSYIDINCAVVTPNAPTSGYVAPEINGDILKVVAGGRGTGSLKMNVLNPTEIKDQAKYSIEFKSDTTYPKYKTRGYQIVRNLKGVVDTIKVVADSLWLTPRNSPPFDGMMVTMYNDTVSVSDTLSGWVVGNNMIAMYDSASRDAGKGSTYPCDYELTFSDSVQELSFKNVTPLGLKFKVRNITEGKRTLIQLKDNDNSLSLTSGDVIQLLEFIGDTTNSNKKYSVEITYVAPPGVTPAKGDIYRVITRRPFRNNDAFSFTTKAAYNDNTQAGNRMKNIHVVPNPYISAAAWERANLNSTGRGERRIDFVNLPQLCTIRIYSISGMLVKTLEKADNLFGSTVSWNLLSEEGMEVAYGLYVYHVDAPGVGSYIGKFAIIK